MKDESEIEDHLRHIRCVSESYVEELLTKIHLYLFL